VNVTCQDCRSVFRVDPAKVPPNGVRARCSVCGAIVRIAVSTVTPLVNPAISRPLTPLRTPVVAGAAPMSVPEVRRPTPAMIEAPMTNLPYPSRPTPSIATPAMQADVGADAPKATPVSGRVLAPVQTFEFPTFAAPDPLSVSRATSSEASASGGEGTAASLTPLELVAEPESGVARDGTPEIVAASLPSVDADSEQVTGVSAPTAVPTPPAAPVVPTVVARPLVPLPPPSPGQLVGMPSSAPATGLQPAAAPSGGERRVINPFLRSDPVTRAKRLARALVSDMVAYQPAKRADGLANGTLKQLFRDEIRKSYDEYVEQVGRDVAESTAFFQDALNEVLAEGKRVF